MSRKSVLGLLVAFAVSGLALAAEVKPATHATEVQSAAERPTKEVGWPERLALLEGRMDRISSVESNQQLGNHGIAGIAESLERMEKTLQLKPVGNGKTRLATILRELKLEVIEDEGVIPALERAIPVYNDRVISEGLIALEATLKQRKDLNATQRGQIIADFLKARFKPKQEAPVTFDSRIKALQERHPELAAAGSPNLYTISKLESYLKISPAADSTLEERLQTIEKMDTAKKQTFLEWLDTAEGQMSEIESARGMK